MTIGSWLERPRLHRLLLAILGDENPVAQLLVQHGVRTDTALATLHSIMYKHPHG